MTREHLPFDRSHLFLMFRVYVFQSLDIVVFPRSSSDSRNPLVAFFHPLCEKAISIISGPAATPRKETVAVISSGLMTTKTGARLDVTKSHELLFPKRRDTSPSFPHLENPSFIEEKIFMSAGCLLDRYLL